MNIVHVGLASFFTEGLTYQDNQLAHQNALDGHNVLYISNAQKYHLGKIVDTSREEILLEDGVHLIRLPYQRIVNTFFSNKIRKVDGLYGMLEQFLPDVILSHGLSYSSAIDVIRYKKKHQFVRLYADTHTASYNSGTNWISLHVLHRVYYRYLTQKALPYLDKYFYVGESERLFSIENYGVPESIMEYYPLGGVLYSKDEYEANRAKRREELGIGNNQRLYIHSGKLTSSKRTVELLKAYSSVVDADSRLIVIGSIPSELHEDIMQLIEQDERITFLGWKSGDELREYLCACDLYCQPGSVSATMQNAICCDCAIMAYPHLPYTTHLDWGNILWVKTQEDMANVFQQITKQPEQLDVLKKNSHRCAEELLDYKKLAARLYQ